MSRPLNCRTRRQAVGSRDSRQMKLVCLFERETWWHIRGLAAGNKISVAEQVRRLCAEALDRKAT
jgi:hypothetical protein